MSNDVFINVAPYLELLHTSVLTIVPVLLTGKASPRRLLSKLNKSRSDKKALCKMQATKSAAATEPRPLARQVYPALTSCDAPVEEILHGLMSSPT